MNASEYLLDDRDRGGRHHAGSGTSVALPWLTVEVALYGLLGLMALMSRFYALGDRPLTVPEATQALHAWQSTSGPGGDALAASPLLFAGQALAFALFGASDGAARLLPALAGTALVALPYLLRHRLGRIGALAASALLLISPTVLFTSRDASGEVLLLTAGLSALVGLVGWVDFCRPAYLYLVAVSAALALMAASGVYTLIVALVATLALLAFLGGRTADEAGWSGLRAAWREVRSQEGWFRTGVALFFGTLILVPTALLLHLEGLQAVADLFPAWMDHFAPWAGDQPLGYPLAVLVMYEPLSLLFGLAGAIVAFRRRDLLGRLLAMWACVALFIALLAGGRGPGDVLLIVGPLSILAGGAVGRLLEEVARHGLWIRDGLIVGSLTAVAAFCYIELASYAHRRETTFLWLAVVSLGLFVSVLALYAAWFGRQAGWRGGGLVLLTLLSLVTASFATNLAYRRAHDPRELLVIEGTSPAVRYLPALLEQASMQRLGATEIIPITADRAVGPVVRWYVRDFRHQTWLSNGTGSEVTTEAVVTPWKPYAPQLGAAYFGQDFVVRTTWQPRNLTGAAWADWLLFRKSPDRPQEDRVVLWLRHQED
jgi:uncharacterized protein (TIGR03663 family)